MNPHDLKAEIAKVIDRFLEGAFTADDCHLKIGSLLFEFEHASQLAWVESGGDAPGKWDE